MPLKYITKKRQGVSSGSPEETSPTPNTVGPITAADFTISGTLRSLLVKQNAILVAHLILAEITNWETSGSIMTIISTDKVPLVITFTSPTELATALATLEGAMNTYVV